MRRLLWLALAVVGSSLLVGGTGGCRFGSPGAAVPIDDNSYTCGCACVAPGRARTHFVSASSDDAEQNGASMNLTDADLDLGMHTVGLRFPAAVPPGATIKKVTVRFQARESSAAATSLQIVGQLDTGAPTFTNASNDLTSRPRTTASVAWLPEPWTAGNGYLTPDLTAIVQELVNQPNWTSTSPIVLRFEGAGQRSAGSFDLGTQVVASLTVAYDPTLRSELPVCATPDMVAQNINGRMPHAVAATDCRERVETTLSSLAAACGYATQCNCDLVIPAKGDGTFDRDVCDAPCVGNPVDPSCADFDPTGFLECVMQHASEVPCRGLVSATHAGNAEPVCVASGPITDEGAPTTIGHLAFGHRTACEVEGTSHIEVGDREPTHDPETVGAVQLLGKPCPGGGCQVAASFALAMDPVTFSVRWASDPTFGDLSASADSAGTTTVNGVDAVFAADAVGGTGNGRRGTNGLAVTSSNQAPLTVGVDWNAKLCDLAGNLASTVDGERPDGTCAGDGATPCTTDSPDCDDVGGPCEFEEEDIEEMLVDVYASGTLVNQPPAAVAGADRVVECTSTAGATFTLEGTAVDPDDDLAVIGWRKGRTGPEVSQELVTTQSLGVGVMQAYVLRTIDTYAQSDEDDALVAVVDTMPPQLSVSVSPAQLRSPNHKLVTVKATAVATDTCDASPAVRLVSITSNEPDNGLGDGDQPRDIRGAAFGTDDREFQLRNERSGTGNGRVYTITYSATDASGNSTLGQATVTVPLS